MTDRPRISDEELLREAERIEACGWHPDHSQNQIARALRELSALRTREAETQAEIADLKTSVIAFGALWAAQYAKDRGLPDGHLIAGHYDILEKAGARMDSFTRAALSQPTGEGSA
ncbi:hypothetical protein ACFOM8_02260 [Paracoccus angustae]|uniref:Uncharacterized protein n=1 Tax=Paracoccus angustae TaxID=1671480 RepID=A0ABV7TZN1_9RHOB